MNQQSRDNMLTDRIMRRIYLVWAVRSLLHPVFLKALIVIVFFYRSTNYISYTNVFHNAPTLTDIPRGLAFVRDAFVHTDSISATLLVGMLALSTWIAFDLVHRPRHAHY